MKMVKPEIEPTDMLPLTPAVFHVLLALADGERHGYAIMQEVAASTDGRIKMGPGTLYGTIKRLLESQLIEESDERPDPHLDDERRRYYRLTGVGEQVVRAEAQRYADMAALARGKRLIGKAALTSIFHTEINLATKRRVRARGLQVGECAPEGRGPWCEISGLVALPGGCP